MKYTADLHIHSKFSRATSRDMTFDDLADWGKVKGISLLASADFTHPGMVLPDPGEARAERATDSSG